ncbi:hypothetical protein [Nannocystis pusilla]|jgi:hypothetical protein|uniref:hypothetical protein n=1 Tax=Nannocystis pusilla TaxID=889268 RepID=UPI003DA60BE2
MHREKVPACVHPETYKYFLERDAVIPTWQKLAARWGEPRHNPSFRTMEIAAPRFTLRSTVLGNPITVLRRRECTADDVAELHALLGYHE